MKDRPLVRVHPANVEATGSEPKDETETDPTDVASVEDSGQIDAKADPTDDTTADVDTDDARPMAHNKDQLSGNIAVIEHSVDSCTVPISDKVRYLQSLGAIAVVVLSDEVESLGDGKSFRCPKYVCGCGGFEPFSGCFKDDGDEIIIPVVSVLKSLVDLLIPPDTVYGGVDATFVMRKVPKYGTRKLVVNYEHVEYRKASFGPAECNLEGYKLVCADPFEADDEIQNEDEVAGNIVLVGLGGRPDKTHVARRQCKRYKAMCEAGDPAVVKDGEAHKRALSALERNHFTEAVPEFEMALGGIIKDGEFIKAGELIDQKEDTDSELQHEDTDLELQDRVQGGGAGGNKGKKGKNGKKGKKGKNEEQAGKKGKNGKKGKKGKNGKKGKKGKKDKEDDTPKKRTRSARCARLMTCVPRGLAWVWAKVVLCALSEVEDTSEEKCQIIDKVRRLQEAGAAAVLVVSKAIHTETYMYYPHICVSYIDKTDNDDGVGVLIRLLTSR